MNKRVSMSLALACLLTSCVSTPILEPYQIGVDGSSSDDKVASVWAWNALLSSMSIKKVDGRILPSREGRGSPYSVILAPGRHALSIYLDDVSNFNPYGPGTKYANLDLDVDLIAGHTYTINRTRGDGHSVQVYVEDMGTNKHCKYVKLDLSVQTGYVPVELLCE